MVMLRAFGATSVNINTGEAAVKSLPRDAAEPPTLSHRWPRCGGRMIIIPKTFARGAMPVTSVIDAGCIVCVCLGLAR
jgi:hypothetical protein